MALRTVVAVLALLFVGGANAATVDVEIRDYFFQPASVTVPVGTTVRWTNKGADSHTVTSDTGAFGSELLATDGTYEFTFAAAGTYEYHCEPHPFMTGTVIVTSSTAPPPPELRIGDRRLREGDAGLRRAIFIVRLSAASAAFVTVGFRTANGTARRRSDYRARRGTLTFAPGETLKRIVVRVVGDRRDERNERFWVLLYGAVNATVADGRGRGLIVDDD